MIVQPNQLLFRKTGSGSAPVAEAINYLVPDGVIQGDGISDAILTPDGVVQF